MENNIKLSRIAFFYLSLELNSPPGSCGGSVIYYSTYVFGRLGEASQHSITIHNIYCLNLFHLPTNLIFWIQYYIPWNVLHFSWFCFCKELINKPTYLNSFPLASRRQLRNSSHLMHFHSKECIDKIPNHFKFLFSFSFHASDIPLFMMDRLLERP